MGTRHLQTVINKQGELKVNQYGQWDGYPSGQGVEILNFLKEANLETYNNELSKLREITEEDTDKIDFSKNWQVEYPHLSRDCCSDIHTLILEGRVEFVQFEDDEEANRWCEGFYTIDLQKREFTTEYYDKVVTFSLDNLPTEEDYLKEFE